MERTYKIAGMTCSGCQSTVQKALQSVHGVETATVNLAESEARIISEKEIAVSELKKALAPHPHYQLIEHGELPLTPLPAIGKRNHTAPAPLTASGNGKYYCPMLCEGDKKYDGPGDCPVCGMPLVKEQTITPGSNTLPEEDTTYNTMLKKFWVALAFTLPIFIISMGEMVGLNLHAMANATTWGWVQFLLSIPVLFYASSDFFKRGYHSMVRWSPNMWTLITLGAGSAYLFSIVALLFPDIFPHQFKMHGAVHLYFEAATVILTLILLGQVLELRAHHQTNSAIRELLSLVPPEATVVHHGNEHKIPVEQVQVNDILKIKPGEKIPVDGIVIKGTSSIDESMLTGEPMPVTKTPDSTVTAGTVNTTGSFEMRAIKVGADTLLAHIIELVNQASRTKAPIQNLADRISKYFVPVVVAISGISFIAWAVWGPEPALVYAFANAVTVLIIACPCALGLATPMAIMVGTGRGAKLGVLVKEARVLEELEKVNVLLIDKTGTLTEGKPSFKAATSITSLFSEEEVFHYAASAEAGSEHPLAHALVKHAQERNMSLYPAEDFQSVTGKGIIANVNGRVVHVGNLVFVQSLGLNPDHALIQSVQTKQQQGETVVYVVIDSTLAGYVRVADTLKPNAKAMVKQLQQQGLKLIMLTGDNAHTAQTIAQELNLDGFQADQLPQDKLNVVKQLQQQGNMVAMAGDGINDSPALAQANVGIAMGTGTDAAIQSAGITLVKGDLSGILRARKLSRDVMRNIRQNLFFAFIYNMIGVPVAAGLLFPFFGLLLSPMLAALAMSLSSVSVIGNSLRLRNASV